MSHGKTLENGVAQCVAQLEADCDRRDRVKDEMSLPYHPMHPTLHLTRKGKASEARPFTCRVQVVVRHNIYQYSGLLSASTQRDLPSMGSI